ncbi:MAG: minor capsid protein [Lachnospiraceae bacterium]|nr:minor capsid protein [Lachnospiraceae bacterium]
MPKLIRPPDKADVTAFLRMLFLRTERELVNEITRKRVTGYVDYAEVAAIERIQKILQTMVDESWSYVPVMIEKIFYQTETGVAGYRNARVLTSTEMSVIQQLSNNLLGELEEAAETAEKNARGFLTVGRLESDPYRREALLQVSRQQAAGTTWAKGSKELAKNLQNKGITAFTDKAGRNWSLQDYSNMAVRTTARQAQVAAILTKDPNHDLYQIVKIGSTCPVCAPLEGRVYSRSGTNPEYPALTLAYGKMDPAGPDDIMNTYLNIHPNCLHSLIPYTTIGKTEKQIQKDKDFSNPEKNPLNRDPRTKKQIAAYREKEKNRRRLLSDKRQYREYRAVLGKEVPKDFDKFLEIKYNKTEKWEAKSREYKTILKIKSKDSYTDTYRKKMIDTYYDFKKHGYEFTDHSLNRFLGQKTGKGKRFYSQDELLDILKKPPNYLEAGGRTVNFYNGIAVIRNQETKEVVSIVTRENMKRGWVSL